MLKLLKFFFIFLFFIHICPAYLLAQSLDFEGFIDKFTSVKPPLKFNKDFWEFEEPLQDNLIDSVTARKFLGESVIQLSNGSWNIAYQLGYFQKFMVSDSVVALLYWQCELPQKKVTDFDKNLYLVTYSLKTQQKIEQLFLSGYSYATKPGRKLSFVHRDWTIIKKDFKIQMRKHHTDYSIPKKSEETQRDTKNEFFKAIQPDGKIIDVEPED